MRRVHGHGLRGLGHKVGACLVQRKPAILGHVHFILHVHRAVLVALLALAVMDSFLGAFKYLVVNDGGPKSLEVFVWALHGVSTGSDM